MKNLNRVRRAPIGIILLIFSASAWATNNNCPSSFTSVATNSLGSGGIGGQTNGITASVSPFASANGCGDINQTFGNFAESGFTGLGGTYAAVSDSSSGVAKQITFQTAITGTVDTTNDFTSGVSSTSGNIAYLTQFGTGTSPALASPSVDALVVQLTGVNLPASDSNMTYSSIAVVVTACQNVTAALTSNFTSCSSGNLAQLSTTFSNTTSTAIANGIETAVLSLGNNFSNIDINTQVTLNGNLNGPASFSDLTEDFEASEPSTFILLGSVLAGIGILRFRKSNVAS
jgi:hypothetical protein